MRGALALVAATVLVGAVRPAVAVGLVEVHALAVERDPTYAAALDDREAAAAELPRARSALLPQLGASAGAGLNRLEADGLEEDFDDTQWRVQIAQPLFDRTSAALVDQAGTAVAQADAELGNAAQTLLLRVATLYVETLRASTNLAFARAELDAIEDQRELAERRFDTGLARVTDVLAAEAQADLAEAQRIAAFDALDAAREALLTVTGVDPGELRVLAPDLPLLPPEPADIDAWAAFAVRGNPELAVARLAAEVAGAGIAVERGARWPSVELVASAGADDTDRALREGETRSARLGVQATLPLYTGGRIGARVARARAGAEAARDRLAGARRAAEQRARDGYRGTLAAIARVRALGRALVSTTRSAEAVETGFRNGTRTSDDVLRALRETFRARTDLANARHDYVLSTLSLEAATGALSVADLEAVDRFLVPAGALDR